jgi:hypothetical protein
MDRGCLAVSFCVEIYAFGVAFGYGFNLLCPCSCCFEFFFPSGAPAVFLEEGYAGYVTSCRVLVVPIASFLSSGKGLEFLLFDGRCRGSPAVAVGSTGSLCTVESRHPSTNTIVYCHSVEKLGLQLLDRRDMTLLQGGAGEVLGFWCHLQSSRF